MTTQNQRVRAMRMEEPEKQIAERAAALRPFIGRTHDERSATLARLLRQERRAAARGFGYDAGRHAALSRLMAECQASGLLMKKCRAGARPTKNKTGRRD